jgi:hypothetical protein
MKRYKYVSEVIDAKYEDIGDIVDNHLHVREGMRVRSVSYMWPVEPYSHKFLVIFEKEENDG